MLIPTNPDRRFLVAVDMESYSKQDNLRQYQSQHTLRVVLDRAVDEVGLDRVRWLTQATGDGELAVLPAGVSEPTVVSRLVPAIDRILRTHNESLVPAARVRLRVALHQGLVHLDSANGFAAGAVVTVCRLLDAPPLKRALAVFTDAATALIVSEEVFGDVVGQRYDGLRPDRFRKVEVRLPTKGFRQWAWIWVPDEDVSQLDGLDGTEPDRPEPDGPEPGSPGGSGPDQPGGPGPDRPHGPRSGDPAAGSTPATTYTFHNQTNHGPAVFGPGGTAIGSITYGPGGRR